MSVSSLSLSAIITDNDVMASILSNKTVVVESCDDLDEFETDEDVKASVLRQRTAHPSVEALRPLSTQDNNWWKDKLWPAGFQDPHNPISEEEVSQPSTHCADTGSSCGSDALKLPDMMTPTTFCGSSACSHLTSISQVMQRCNASLGSVGDSSTPAERKRKYNTFKNGKRSQSDSRGNVNSKRRLVVAPDELRGTPVFATRYGSHLIPSPPVGGRESRCLRGGCSSSTTATWRLGGGARPACSYGTTSATGGRPGCHPE
jgi:hypothetical protein